MRKVRTISIANQSKPMEQESSNMQIEIDSNADEAQNSRVLYLQSHLKIFKSIQPHQNIQVHPQANMEKDDLNQGPVLEENNKQDELKEDKYETYKQMCKDIEFIQMLGNPYYLICLRNKGYFYSKDFKDYIYGLKCFLNKPEFIRLIKYPEGLYNLQLLLKKGFIEALENNKFQQKFIAQSIKRSLKIQKYVINLGYLNNAQNKLACYYTNISSMKI